MATKKKNSPFYKSHDHRPYNFPKGFLWGTATSAHQVEGNNSNNDWWTWEQQKGHITDNDKSLKATNQYNLYEKDFDLIEGMHHNVHRLSIEWSRIEPEEEFWDLEQVEHYKNVLKALKKRKIKVMLTLHHFTNPIWFSNKGGWESKYAPYYFERYVKFISQHLYKYVDFWITINEPIVYTSMGYIEGVWPPGKQNLYAAHKVFKHLIKAHKKAYRAIHTTVKKLSQKKTRVGIAKNTISFEAYNKHSLLDTFYTYLVNRFWNHTFLDRTKKYHDFIGMNYYFHQRLERKKGTIFSLSFSSQIQKQRRDLNDLGWEIYPAGIFSTLMDMRLYNLPIYITENGIATNNDNKRIRFILAHLTEINRAINAGVKVKGYCYWSLLDNFEWHLGYEPHFGLIAVNYKTFKRTPRKSSEILSEIARTNQIEHDLLQYLGHTPHHREPEVCKLYYNQNHKHKD